MFDVFENRRVGEEILKPANLIAGDGVVERLVMRGLLLLSVPVRFSRDAVVAAVPGAVPRSGAGFVGALLVADAARGGGGGGGGGSAGAAGKAEITADPDPDPDADASWTRRRGVEARNTKLRGDSRRERRLLARDMIRGGGKMEVERRIRVAGETDPPVAVRHHRGCERVRVERKTSAAAAVAVAGVDGRLVRQRARLRSADATARRGLESWSASFRATPAAFAPANRRYLPLSLPAVTAVTDDVPGDVHDGVGIHHPPAAAPVNEGRPGGVLPRRVLPRRGNTDAARAHTPTENHAACVSRARGGGCGAHRRVVARQQRRRRRRVSRGDLVRDARGVPGALHDGNVARVGVAGDGNGRPRRRAGHALGSREGGGRFFCLPGRRGRAGTRRRRRILSEASLASATEPAEMAAFAAARIFSDIGTPLAICERRSTMVSFTTWLRRITSLKER